MISLETPKVFPTGGGGGGGGSKSSSEGRGADVFSVTRFLEFHLREPKVKITWMTI